MNSTSFNLRDIQNWLKYERKSRTFDSYYMRHLKLGHNLCYSLPRTHLETKNVKNAEDFLTDKVTFCVRCTQVQKTQEIFNIATDSKRAPFFFLAKSFQADSFV